MRLPRPVVLFLLCAMSATGGATSTDLIAHYRFETNGCDTLGRGTAFLLTNHQPILGVPAVLTNANPPFTNGALYIDGRYEPNGHFVHYLGTEPLNDLRYDAFTVSLDFYPLPKRRGIYDQTKVEQKLDSWTHGRYARWRGFERSSYHTDNILTVCYHYRWFGLNREAGTLNLTLNNQAFVHRFDRAAVKTERWHHVVCSLDLGRKEIMTMFDGRLLETVRLPADFKFEVMGSTEETKDREFTFANYSNGSVYYGYAANLKIFGHALTAAELPALFSASLKERPAFPRHSFSWLMIPLAVAICFMLLFLLRRQLGLARVRCSEK